MIKNLIALTIPKRITLTASHLDDALSSAQFSPCTPMQAVSVGWGVRGEDESFAKKIGNNIVMTYISEKKSVPGPVLKDAIREAIKEYELENDGNAPGKAEMKLIKEDAMARLLPRAFPKRSETLVWFDLDNQTLNFNTSSTTRMEEALSSLTRNVTEFPEFQHIQTVQSPTVVMAEWLLSEAPHKLTVDDKCELVAPAENKPTIKYVRHSLDGSDIRDHIKDGKIPVSLAMTFNDRISFTFTDKMGIKGITPLDIIGSELEEVGAETSDQVFAAEFMIIADEAGHLLQALIESMGGLQPQPA